MRKEMNGAAVARSVRMWASWDDFHPETNGTAVGRLARRWTMRKEMNGAAVARLVGMWASCNDFHPGMELSLAAWPGGGRCGRK